MDSNERTDAEKEKKDIMETWLDGLTQHDLYALEQEIGQSSSNSQPQRTLTEMMATAEKLAKDEFGQVHGGKFDAFMKILRQEMERSVTRVVRPEARRAQPVNPTQPFESADGSEGERPSQEDVEATSSHADSV